MCLLVSHYPHNGHVLEYKLFTITHRQEKRGAFQHEPPFNSAKNHCANHACSQNTPRAIDDVKENQYIVFPDRSLGPVAGEEGAMRGVGSASETKRRLRVRAEDDGDRGLGVLTLDSWQLWGSQSWVYS
jgi:hypothetical protein